MTKDKMIQTVTYSMEQLSDLMTYEAREQGFISEFAVLTVTDFYKTVNNDGETLLKIEMESANDTIH